MIPLNDCIILLNAVITVMGLYHMLDLDLPLWVLRTADKILCGFVWVVSNCVKRG